MANDQFAFIPWSISGSSAEWSGKESLQNPSLWCRNSQRRAGRDWVWPPTTAGLRRTTLHGNSDYQGRWRKWDAKIKKYRTGEKESVCMHVCACEWVCESGCLIGRKADDNNWCINVSILASCGNDCTFTAPISVDVRTPFQSPVTSAEQDAESVHTGAGHSYLGVCRCNQNQPIGEIKMEGEKKKEKKKNE